MLVLGIETSCDETSVAIVENGVTVRANVVSSQARLHERFGGVVPEIASRAHLAAILPVLDEAFAKAGCGITDCDAIAVTHRPGLIGALLVGVTAAKTLSFLHGIPIVPIDHLAAHLYALEMTAPQGGAPRLALLVSGGHTALYRMESPTRSVFLGGTVDDAAGEAFDKVAKLLGLGYPGGPLVQKAAEGGDPRAIDFPRAHLAGSRRFSFSGLKTAVLYRVRGWGARPPETTTGRGNAAFSSEPVLAAREKADIAASFQQAVVDVLVRKTVEAAGVEGIRSVGVAGGVAANRPLREALASACRERGWEMVLPPMAYCTDNAAMVAGLGWALFREGKAAPLDFDAFDHVA